MAKSTRKIGVVAPGSPITTRVGELVLAQANSLYGERSPDIRFHPQCFERVGHFAGSDARRTAAFLEVANDPSYDAIWFARGGYGANRIAETIVQSLSNDAAAKTYLGYSDGGALLAALYKSGIGRPVHGPMPGDVERENGGNAISRALAFLVDSDLRGFEPSIPPNVPVVAFNLSVLCSLLQTPPALDLKGHILMLEDIDEDIFKVDLALFQLTSNLRGQGVAGIQLGRFSNAGTFPGGATEVDIARHWCGKAGIAFLGHANIGHDAENRIVPFGTQTRWQG
ncbi:MAG: LD-carboxypeptidase [Terricaulis sp.]